MNDDNVTELHQDDEDMLDDLARSEVEQEATVSPLVLPGDDGFDEDAPPDGPPLPRGVTSREEAEANAQLAAQAAEAEATIAAIDDDPSGLPPLRYMPLMPFWQLECTMIGDEPAVVITLAHPAIPNGIPFLLDRDRALKFASQIKKAAQTGPQRIEVVKKSLILPGQG